MIRQRILSACILFILALSSVSWAENTDVTVTKDPLIDKFTVCGKIEEAVISGKVSVLVVSTDNDIAHMTNVSTDENGAFTYSFTMSNDVPSGWYSVKVSAYNRAEPVVVPFEEYYVSATRKDIILSQINSEVTTVDELKAYMTDSVMKEIGISWPSGLKLSQASKDKVYSDIFGGRTYPELRDLKELFFCKTSLYALNEATASNVNSVWTEYCEFYDISKALMNETYQAYSQTEKDAAIRRIAGNEIGSEEDMVEAFDSAVFLQELSETKSYSEVNTLFEDYSDAVTFDLTTFNALNPVSRGNALCGKSFDKMSDLKTAVDNMKASGSIVPDGDFSGTGGGGGRGVAMGAQNQGRGEIATDTEIAENILFSDISKEFWAYDAIEKLVDEGIISGYPDKTFLPDNYVTREEFVAILVRYLNLELNTECDFDDVPTDRWSYPYIAAAYNKGIIKGNSEQLFGAENVLTRQDMAVIIARALSVDESDINTEEFTDESMISEYAKNSVKALRSEGIINGFEDNSFRPLENSTRAEAATVIYKISKGV